MPFNYTYNFYYILLPINQANLFLVIHIYCLKLKMFY